MKEINFKYVICSDVDFEDLVAEIGYNLNRVCTLTQENGFDKMRVILYPPKDKEYWDFPLNDFLKVIEDAKSRLWEFRKLPENPEDIYVPRFAPGNTAIVNEKAPLQYKPGMVGIVRSMRNIDSYELANALNEVLGEELYLLEFEDHSLIEVPDRFMDKN